MFLKRATFFLAVLATLTYSTSAQIFNPKWEIGLGPGGFLYQGDLSNQQLGNFKDMQYGGGIFLRYYISPMFSLRANYYYGGLKGDDTQFSEEWRKKRAYKFTSPLSEASVLLEADLLGPRKFRSYRSPEAHDKRWSFYLFVGAGVAFADASRDWSGLDRVYFGKDATENIPQDSMNTPDKTLFVLPAGFGLRYDLSKQWSVFADAGYRFVFSDNLDGYKYAVYSPRNDGYSIYSLGISMRFGKKEKELPSGSYDFDRDGVWNVADSCPHVAGIPLLNGCPDKDGDGIADRYDQCPDSAGIAELYGCPDHDRDGDGIPDRKDACPDDPGMEATHGCPDKDADGIPDKDDACPEIPGAVKDKGCPPQDTDKVTPVNDINKEPEQSNH